MKFTLSGRLTAKKPQNNKQPDVKSQKLFDMTAVILYLTKFDMLD